MLVRDGTTRCAAHKVKPGSFADPRRGTRHERGYGTAWDHTRERIMRRDGGLCQPSLRHGLVVTAHMVDHKVPKARGGTDDDDNLQAISRAVHQAKTDAEKRGAVWDEHAHFASGEGGGEISATRPRRTEREGKFLRESVSGNFSG